MTDVKNILLVGVGGQGTILASKILSEVLLEAGYDVKMSEVHGMAQRGGSVSTQIRYGKKVYGPIIGKGEADIIVSFEKMEAVRWAEYLKVGGTIVINDFEIPSAPILSGNAKYPEGVIEELKTKAKTISFNGTAMAKELGNIRTMNIILLGTLVKGMGLEDLDWESKIKKNVKDGFEDINIEAFNLGKKQI
jgi:indolepyruvate ferredoxin oxidoreductase beta subunit